MRVQHASPVPHAFYNNIASDDHQLDLMYHVSRSEFTLRNIDPPDTAVVVEASKQPIEVRSTPVAKHINYEHAEISF
ncbi:MAG: hypothetical protein WD851_03905 [Pirellulales bacterium]